MGGGLNLGAGDWMQVLRELETITKKDYLQLELDFESWRLTSTTHPSVLTWNEFMYQHSLC